MVTGYAVTWFRKPIAQPYILDVDTPELAAEIAIRLHEQPRVYDVKVTTLEYEVDMTEAEAIKARIKRRIDEQWALGWQS